MNIPDNNLLSTSFIPPQFIVLKQPKLVKFVKEREKKKSEKLAFRVLSEKRFYSRGRIRCKRVSKLAKIPT